MAKKKKSGKKPSSGAGNGRYAAIGLMLMALVCAGWMFLKPARTVVPSVVGKTLTEATELLKLSDLAVISKTQATDDPAQNGKVLSQTPASGADVPTMSVVTVVVAKGPDGIPVPDLLGKTRSEAEDTLLRLGLKVQFTEAKSDEVPIGRVVSQQPAAGGKVAPKGTVALIVSGGVGEIAVPDLHDMTVDEARAALDGLGLTLDIAEVAQDNFRDGDPAYILRQEPAAGETLAAGAKVTVFIPIAPPVGGTPTPGAAGSSSGAHAPRFEGLTVSQARKLADQERVTLELADSADDSSVITFQDPPPGDPVAGSVVVRVSESAVVPSLSGLTETEARVQLEKAGLTVGAIKKSRGDVAGEVLDQRPSPGIEALAGSSVDLVVSDPGAAASSASNAPAATPAFTPAPWAR